MFFVRHVRAHSQQHRTGGNPDVHLHHLRDPIYVTFRTGKANPQRYTSGLWLPLQRVVTGSGHDTRGFCGLKYLYKCFHFVKVNWAIYFEVFFFLCRYYTLKVYEKYAYVHTHMYSYVQITGTRTISLSVASSLVLPAFHWPCWQSIFQVSQKESFKT